MSWLDGGAAALFGELLTPIYLPGWISTEESTYDTKGNLSLSGTPRPCRAQVDRCTERMVNAEGYTDTDRAVYVLATSLEGDVLTGQIVTVTTGPYAGAAFRVSSPVDRDPAAAYWLFRGARVKATGNG